MAGPSGVRLPSLRQQFARSFVLVFVLSLVCTAATWALSLHLLIGDRTPFLPANHYEQQIPDIVAFAHRHHEQILSSGFQERLEQAIPLEGIGYQVLDRGAEVVYGSDPAQYVNSVTQLIGKLNTSERVDDRIVTYYPLADSNGSWLATLVLSYRISLLSSNPNQRTFVLGFIIGNMIVPFFFILTFTAWVARRLSGRLEDPIDRLIAAAERIKARNLDFTLREVGGSRELVQLAGAIEEMRSALHESLTTQWHMEQERRDMVANIAHDLQTPLTVIAGHVDNLIEAKEKREERLERYLLTIRDHTDRATRLVNDMRTLADVEHQEMTLDLRPLDIQRFFGELNRRFSTLCSSAAINFEFTIESEDGAGPVHVDAHRLDQILTNVVENSIRYTPAGGVILLNVRLDHRGLHVEICDNGPGFDRKDLPHVFERFYQGDASRSRHVGMGLGLNIVKTLTEKHGGQVKVDNRPEGGAQVRIRLPGSLPQAVEDE